jgi:hypothetical protein
MWYMPSEERVTKQEPKRDEAAEMKRALHNVWKAVRNAKREYEMVASRSAVLEETAHEMDEMGRMIA